MWTMGTGPILGKWSTTSRMTPECTLWRTPTKEGKSRGCTLAGAIKHKDILYVESWQWKDCRPRHSKGEG